MKFLHAIIISSCLALVTACGDETVPSNDALPSNQQQGTTDSHAGHNHDDHDHEGHDHTGHVHTEDLSYDDLTGLARLAMDSSDYETAILRYMDAIAADSSRVEGYYGIGYSFSILGNPVKAKEYFETAHFINPDYRNIRLNLGTTRIQTDEVEEGIALLGVQIEKDKNCGECYMNRAQGFMLLEKKEEMCADLRNAESKGVKEATELLATHCAS